MGPAARVKGWEFVAGGTSSRTRTANGPAVQTSKTPKMTKQWKNTPLLLVLDLDALGLRPPALADSSQCLLSMFFEGISTMSLSHFELPANHAGANQRDGRLTRQLRTRGYEVSHITPSHASRSVLSFYKFLVYILWPAAHGQAGS